MRWLIRSIATLVAWLTMLLAVAIVAGRVGVALLPSFESDLNELLVSRDIQVRGISGRWRYLNPVVEIEALTFTGGRAMRLGVELDLLESLWYLDPVVRVARADALELSVVHNVDGRWTLGTRAGPAGELRIGEWLRQGDAFLLPAVHITLLDQQGDSVAVLGEYAVAVNVVNASARHRGHIVAALAPGPAGAEGVARSGEPAESGEGLTEFSDGLAEPACERCELVVEWDLSESAFGTTTAGELSASAKNLQVPQPLGLALGAGAFRIDSMDARWRVSNGIGAGTVRLQSSDLTLRSGRLDELRLDAAVGARDDEAAWGHFDTLEVRAADDVFSLAGATFVANTEGPRIDVSVPEIDLQSITRQVRAAGVSVEPLVRWIDALQPRGRLEELKARIDVASGTVSAVGHLEDGAMENYKGIPLVRGARARVLVFERGIAVDMVDGPAAVGLLDLFAETSQLDRFAGRVFMWLVPDYLGVRGTQLEATLGESSINGSFAVSRPRDVLEQRIIANVGLRKMDADVAKRYIPPKLPEALVKWLDQGIVAGHMDELALVYHGHLRNVPELPMRRIEMNVTMHDGVVRYHPDWPIATGLDGELNVTFEETRAELVAGRIEGLTLDSGTLVAPKGADHVLVDGSGKGDGQQVLDFFRASPLAKLMPQLDPSWTAEGPLQFAGALKIPIRAGGTLAVDVDAALTGVTLHVANLGLSAGDLTGNVHYTHPFIASASDVHGTLFGKPATFGAESHEDQSVRLTFEGNGTVDDIAAWLKVDPVVFEGHVEFAGGLSFWPGTKRSPELEVGTDLVGVTVALPAELGKTADVARDSHIRVRFGPKVTSFAIASPGVAGWVHLENGKVMRGSIGVGVPAVRETMASEAILLTGRLSDIDLSEWMGGSLDSGTTRLPAFNVQNFEIDKVRIRDLAFTDVLVNADGSSEGFGVSVKAPALAGSYREVRGQTPKLVVERLELPPGEAAGDPLANFDQKTVPDLDADISGVTAGGVDRGKWKVSLRQRPEGLAFTNLDGDLNGLHVTSETGGMWLLDSGTTFAGRVVTEDVSKVLVAYGYAPSVETKSVKVDAQVSWPGSPLNFALQRLSGKLAFKAKDGRFVEVDGAGGTRIFSLLNFTAIAKRMTLDFSDVFGKGVSFDEVTAETDLDHGMLRFTEPLEVAGTGSNFRVSGTVDLKGGALDNEMIVTLPVSASLPWYAAYLGFFANPLAGGAVILGERIFRNQIEQFSSAKYRIEGTLDEPKVTFVRVFSNSMDESPTETTKTDPPADAAADPDAETETDADTDNTGKGA